MRLITLESQLLNRRVMTTLEQRGHILTTLQVNPKIWPLVSTARRNVSVISEEQIWQKQCIVQSVANNILPLVTCSQRDTALQWAASTGHALGWQVGLCAIASSLTEFFWSSKVRLQKVNVKTLRAGIAVVAALKWGSLREKQRWQRRKGVDCVSVPLKQYSP
eukprot:648357-Ditylum_brightwellii.AAC.1